MNTRALNDFATEIMSQLGCFLRALYRTLEEPGANPLREAHTRLDTAAAYGMPKDADPLTFLLTLAAKEKAGEEITPPASPCRNPNVRLSARRTASAGISSNKPLEAREGFGHVLPCEPPRCDSRGAGTVATLRTSSRLAFPRESRASGSSRGFRGFLSLSLLGVEGFFMARIHRLSATRRAWKEEEEGLEEGQTLAGGWS